MGEVRSGFAAVISLGYNFYVFKFSFCISNARTAGAIFLSTKIKKFFFGSMVKIVTDKTHLRVLGRKVEL